MNAASWLEGLPASERWRAVLRTGAPRFATWALALALGVQAAFIVTDLAGAGRPAHSATPLPPRLQSRFTDIAAITNAHLFGAAPVAPRSDASAPQTSMPLVLTGIIADNDPQNGLAILGQSAQTAKVHVVGDTVPGGARLHSVYYDRVIIDRNGQLESLILPRQITGAAPAPSAASPTTVHPPRVPSSLPRAVRTDFSSSTIKIRRPAVIVSSIFLHFIPSALSCRILLPVFPHRERCSNYRFSGESHAAQHSPSVLERVTR